MYLPFCSWEMYSFDLVPSSRLNHTSSLLMVVMMALHDTQKTTTTTSVNNRPPVLSDAKDVCDDCVQRHRRTQLLTGSQTCSVMLSRALVRKQRFNRCVLNMFLISLSVFHIVVQGFWPSSLQQSLVAIRLCTAVLNIPPQHINHFDIISGLVTGQTDSFHHTSTTVLLV